MRQITYEDLRTKIANAYKNRTTDRSFFTGVSNGFTSDVYKYGLDYGNDIAKRTVMGSSADEYEMNVSRSRTMNDDLYDHSENMKDRLSRLLKML